MVTAEPDLLRQAIGNLLSNALRYTPEQGKIQVRVLPSPQYLPQRVTIQVRDTGMGIPPADLPYIFDRFYRVDQVRSRQAGGFGLGLSIVRQIVGAHGGEITVQSKLGEGSSFEIHLPLRQPSPLKP